MRKRAVIVLAVLMLSGCGVSLRDLPAPKEAQTTFYHFLEERPGELSVKGQEGEQAQGSGQFLLPGSTYAYDRLTDAEKIWYRDMENTLGNMAQSGKLSEEGIRLGLAAEDIDRIFQSVMLDHPELFFVDGYSYNSYLRAEQLISLEFSGNYNVDRESALRKLREILAAADEILAAAPDEGDDYEKVRYVYETLIRRTDYDSAAPDNQNIYSVLVGGLSVCQGYAKATQFLLNRLGVECTLVQGTVGGERHGWNLVKADGDYYYLDTTWGDASYKSAQEGSAAVTQDINYDYLCVTTRELLLTHSIDAGMSMPECTALRDNYYVREGAYFSEPDEERLRNLFARADAQNNYFVTIKCADGQCYQELFRTLVEEKAVFDYYPQEAGRVVYIQNEKQFSLTFWMTNE